MSKSQKQTKMVRVPQGRSVTYNDIRYHQGQEFEAPADYVLPGEPPAPPVTDPAEPQQTEEG